MMEILSYPVTLTLNPIVLLILVALVITWILKIKNDYSLLTKLGIPGPKPIMVFGSLHEFRDKFPLDVFKQWRKLYGDIYGFFEGFKPCIVVNCPEMAKQILVKHFDKFHNRPVCYPFVYSPDETSLLNVDGSEWRRQRSIVATALNSACMKQTTAQTNLIGEKFCSKVADKNQCSPEGFDISRFVDKYALDAFAKSGFDYDANSLDNEDAILYRFMKAYVDSASTENQIGGLARVYNGLIPFLKLFDYKHKKVHYENVAEIRKHVQKKRQEYSQEKTANQKDILGQLMNGTFFDRDEQGIFRRRLLKDEEILGHMNTLIGGGIGTLNSSISFVIHLLAVNPSVQQKVFQEIVKICGHDKAPSYDDIRKLDYLEMVMQETLRILPCAPGVTRTCTEDCTINNVQIKKGFLIRIMTCTIYSDENVFPHPDKFIPERFSPEAMKTRHAYNYLPYGQGPRMCPGVKFADIQTKVLLVKLLQKFIIKPCARTVDPLPTALRPMLVPKDGVFVQLEERVRPNIRSNTCSA